MQKSRRKDGLPFMKMHGAGNDFVIVDSRSGPAMVTGALARRIGDRHRGVGFDQLAEIRPGTDADLELVFWNADGSRSGACGNATRCVASHVMEEDGATRLSIRTGRGILQARRDPDGSVRVNMGAPQLSWQDIPLAKRVDIDALPLQGMPSAVGMGNPHCVFFVEDVEKLDIAALGARSEHDPLFPAATNVEFVQVRSPGEIRMRVWERGTGITLACGSGACAVAVAAHRRGLTGRKLRIQADGGWLNVDWRDDGVWLGGPVAHVFDARLTRAFLEAEA